MQAVIGRLAIMDALLDLTVALTIFWWFRSLEAGRDRYFVYGSIAAAIGFLAKGPVAPVIAMLVIVPFTLWNGRVERTRLPSWRGWVLSAVFAVLIVSPWLGAIAIHSGPHALVELIGHYTVGRYTGVIENQAGPLWYYLPVLILGFFPWIAFLPMAIVYGVREMRSGSADPNIARLWRLGFTWMVVPLVFFSFAKTKLPNYIALEFPALALVTALYFDRVVRRGVSRSAIVSAASVPVFIGMVAFAIWLFVRDNKLTTDALSVAPDLIVMGASIFVGSVLTAVLLGIRSTVGIAPYALSAATIVAMDILAIVALPHAEAFKPIPHLAPIINASHRAGDAIAIQNFRGGNALLFYTRPPVYGLPGPDDSVPDSTLNARSVICSHARVWVVAPRHRPAHDPTYGRTRTLEGTWGGGALFLYSGPRCRDAK
jgi:4-amino-4-deoxy-L-arabinose transferase-like glycosyltransferase